MNLAYLKFNHNGQDIICKGYKLLAPSHRDNYVFTTEEFEKEFKEEFAGFVKTHTISPQKDMKVYVYPECPIPAADIRKDYAVKRDMNDADFVVYNDVVGERKSWYSIYDSFIIPSIKTIITVPGWDHYDALLRFAVEKIDNFQNLVDSGDVIHIKNRLYFLMYSNKTIKYMVDYYNMAITKPIVNCKDLPSFTHNDLTQEALNMFYTVGVQPGDSNNFILQLQALGQTDWKKYAGTIGLVYDCIRKNRKSNSCSCYAVNHPSQMPKAAKTVFNAIHKCPDFENDEDRELAREYIEKTCNLSGKEYHTMQDLAMEFSNARIDFEYFYRLYDNIVKIRPKCTTK